MVIEGSRGNYGSAFLALDKATGQKVVVKKIETSHMSPEEKERRERMSRRRMEKRRKRGLDGPPDMDHMPPDMDDFDEDMGIIVTSRPAGMHGFQEVLGRIGNRAGQGPRGSLQT